MKIDLLKIYEKKNAEKIKFDYDQKSKKRPAWIKLTNTKIKPGFLRVRINDTAEIIYRAFGNYFYPLDSTPKEQKQFIAGVSTDYDSVVANNNIFWSQKLVEKLEKLGLKKNAQIVDLGAGTGIASEVMIDKGYKNLTLIDYSSEMLAVAKKKPKLSQAKFIVADVKKLNLKKKYDAVISIMLFDSIKPKKNLEKTLTRVKMIMKPHALIALVEDNKETTYSRLFEKIEDGKTQTTPTLNITRYYFIGRKS